MKEALGFQLIEFYILSATREATVGLEAYLDGEDN